MFQGYPFQMRPPYRINLTQAERKELKQLIRQSTAPPNLVKRAKIILLANEEGQSNPAIATSLGLYPCEVTLWTKRWIERALDPVKQRLGDWPRSGAPSRITPEQWCQIMALAGEPPANHGYPITHGSGGELRTAILKQGIVKQISKSHLNEFLKKLTGNHTAVVTGSIPNRMNVIKSALPISAKFTKQRGQTLMKSS